MVTERPTNINQGTLLAERILSDERIVRTLIFGEESDINTIVKKIASDVLKLNSIEQSGFLRKLFLNLAIEGDAEVTDRHDATLAFLTHTENDDIRLTNAMIPIVKSNRAAVCDAYLEAVYQQTKDNDPYFGSIDALLKAGKAIAHFIPRGSQKKQILDEWERVTEEFPTIDQRFYIRSKVDEIKLRMSSSR